MPREEDYFYYLNRRNIVPRYYTEDLQARAGRPDKLRRAALIGQFLNGARTTPARGGQLMDPVDEDATPPRLNRNFLNNLG
jgi:hypothetical protein